MVRYDYNAVVINVVDGDTLDLSVDLGFRCMFTDRFRLAGVDTPERGQPGWAEATEFLREKLSVGDEVVITTMKNPRDKYGRWLATIHAPGERNSINEQLISSGHAKAYGG